MFRMIAVMHIVDREREKYARHVSSKELECEEIKLSFYSALSRNCLCPEDMFLLMTTLCIMTDYLKGVLLFVYI